MTQYCYLQRYFGIDIVSCRPLQWMGDCKDRKWIETQANRKIQDIQQPDKYETDSESQSGEEDDFEVVFGGTCMTRQEGSVRDHDWCVWNYEAGAIQ